MKQLFLLAVIMVSLPLFALGQTTKNEPLQKSLKKLKNDLSKYGHYQDPLNQTITYRIKPINFKGCEVMFGYEILVSHDSSQSVFRNNAVVRDSIRFDRFLSPSYQSIVKFDFAKLDSASVKLINTGETSKLFFESLKGETAIQEKDSRTTTALRETTLPISLQKAAGKIQEEFINVIRGCQTAN